jgi:hypothetical protein
MISIANNSWPGFQGLYHSTDDGYYYLINNNSYLAYNLQKFDDAIVANSRLILPFTVDPAGSQLLAINLGNVHMIYQLNSTGRFVELLSRQPNPGLLSMIGILEVPLPNGHEVTETRELTALEYISNPGIQPQTHQYFQKLPLRQIYPWVQTDIGRALYINRITNYDQILDMLNERTPVPPLDLMSPVAPMIEDYRTPAPMTFQQQDERVLQIAPNSWPGFQGLYYLDGFFDYIINDRIYGATNLMRYNPADTNVQEIMEDGDLVPPFAINLQGSKILAIYSENWYMLYQKQNNEFVELTPRQGQFNFDQYEILKVPLPNGEVDENGVFQMLPLTPIDESTLNILENEIENVSSYDQFLAYLNRRINPIFSFDERVGRELQRNEGVLTDTVFRGGTPSLSRSPTPPRFHSPNFRSLSPQRGLPPLSRSLTPDIIINPHIIRPQRNEDVSRDEPDLHKMSYETLLKQLYNLPVQLPEFLIQNGLRITFISFEQIPKLQIERYIFDTILQPWAGPPGTLNKIITIFTKNGITYFAKVRYDQVSNQIFPPV